MDKHFKKKKWESKEEYEQLMQFPKKNKLNQTRKTFIPTKKITMTEPYFQERSKKGL